MCNAMNPGWAFTTLAFVYALYTVVAVWIMKKGMKWRQQAAEKKKNKKKEEDERAATEDVASQSNADHHSSNEKEVEHQVAGEK